MTSSPPLDGLDLNLLHTLHVLLRESNVSQAARELGTTQPTVSRALAALRLTFGDPLLVRTGRGMELSPFARSLRDPLQRVLATVDRLRSLGDFEADVAERCFRLLIPDVVGFRVVPALGRVFEETKALRLEVLGMEGEALSALLGNRTDLVAGAQSLENSELYSRVVGPPVGMSVLLGRRHPFKGGRLRYREWLRSEHLQLMPEGRPHVASQLDRHLESRGDTRSIRSRVAYLSGLVECLEDSRLVASLPTPTAAWLAKKHQLRVCPHPVVELERLTFRLSWHVVSHQDQGHRWFRELVAREMESFLRQASSGSPS